MEQAADNLILSIMTLRTTSLLPRARAAAAAGFSGMGWRWDDFAADNHDELARQVAAIGVELPEVEFFREWVGREADPAYVLAEARLFELAAAVGARHLNTGVFVPAEHAAVATSFAGLCRRAAPYGLIVQLEFMPYTPPVNSLRAAWDIVRAADAPNAGLLIDAWHWTRTPGSRETLRDIPPQAVTSIQLGDVRHVPMADIVEEARHHRCVPGDGAVDLAGFVHELRGHGVDAPLSVEVMSDELDAMEPTEAAVRVARGTRQALRRGV